MKKTCLFLAVALVLTSCKKDNTSIDSSTIGGSTNIPINTVGNTFSNSVSSGISAYQGTITITKVTDGVSTILVEWGDKYAE